MSATEDLKRLLDNLELASASRAIVRLQGSVDEVLHEDIPVLAARSAIVSAFAALKEDALRKDAEIEKLREDGQLLDWLDTLPCGISILADANFPQPRLMTPKAQGFSHTRQLIRETRAEREKVATECPGTPYELDGAIKCWTCGAMWGAVPKPDSKTHAVRRISSSGADPEKRK